MQLTLLDQKHPEWDAESWADNLALYEGGDKFRKRINRFLPMNPMETAEMFANRCAHAKYRSYIGSIVDFLTGSMFEQSFSANAADKSALEEFYTDFRDNCDGQGTDMADFLRARFVAAMMAPRSFWVCEMVAVPDLPEGASLADFKREVGTGSLRLVGVDASSVYDWKLGSDGRYDWVIVHSLECDRADVFGSRKMVTERWKLYDRETVREWTLVYEKGQRPSGAEAVAVESMQPTPHGFTSCPVLSLGFPPGLRLVERLRDAQLSHFESDAALRHTLRMTAYAMPYISSDQPNQDKPQRMGAGHFLMLTGGAKAGFLEPQGSAASLLATKVDSDRQEIYRLAHQMALGIDNNASAVGRSAESKSVDSKSSNTMLDAWGAAIRESVKAIYDLISAARVDGKEWTIEGFDSFDTVDLSLLLEASLQVDSGSSIPSPTFKRELGKRIANKLLPDLSAALKEKIEKEIDANVSDEPDPLAEEMKLAREAAARVGAPPLGAPPPGGEV